MKLKIHQALLSKISSEKHLLKNVSTFLALKTIHSSGIIINLSERRTELANKCFISKRTFDNRLSALQKEGFLFIKNNQITLLSFENLYKALDLDTTRKKYYYHKLEQNPEYIIRAIIAKDHLFKQEQRINFKIKKHVNSSILEAKQIEAIRLLEYERLIKSIELRLNYQNYFNPDVSISQLQMANLFGLQCQTSGYYWQRRLSGMKLMDVEQRVIQLQKKSSKKKGKPVNVGYLWQPRGMNRELVQMRNNLKFS